MNPVFITVVIGILAGVVGGLLGVGGGIVMVPCFKYLLKFDMHQAVGTSLAVITVATLAGAARHATLGHVVWRTAAIVVLFVAVGTFLGADLTQKLSSPVLQKIFGVWMIGVGVFMVMK